MFLIRTKLLLGIVGFSCLAAAQGRLKHNYTLQGKCEESLIGKVFLSYENEYGKLIQDSALVRKGIFSFTGYINLPVSVSLYSKPFLENKSVNFFIEPATLQILLPADNWENAKVAGSGAQKEMDLYKENLADINKELEPLDARFNAANRIYIKAKKEKLDSAILDSLLLIADNLRDQYDTYTERIEKRVFEFFRVHPTSIVTAFNLQYYIGSLPLDTLVAYYNRLGKITQQTNPGKDLAVEIAKIRSGTPGTMAKNFTTTDIAGQPFSLTALKGKYVLLDFWASWCVPCRKGNPHLIELYTQYKSKGFEVVGVSDDDQNLPAWKNAVMKDALPWLQVLRGYRRNSEKTADSPQDISDLYGVHTLPTQILINPAGEIVGRYGGGGEEHEALDKKLATIFPN